MIRKILKSVREYKKETILTPVFMIGEVFTDVLMPFLIGKLLDYGVTLGNMKAIILYGSLLLIAVILSLTFGILSGRFASIASNGFAKNLRHDLYYKVQDYSFKNIDKFSTSSIITRLTTDVQRVQQAFQMSIRIAVRAPMMFLFSLIMTFIVSPKIAMVFAIIVPIIFVILILISKIAMPVFEQTFKTYDDLNNVVKENVGGIRVVKSYVQEEKEIKKFNKVSNKIFKLFKRAERIVATTNPVMDISMYFAVIFVVFVGAKQIAVGTLTTGALSSLITYSLAILTSLMMVSMIYVMLLISYPSMERIYELLKEKPDITNPNNPIKKVLNGDIVFNNVSFSYVDDPNKLALKDINLKINSGEVIGIIGGTGSGKSTLVNLIPRLYDVTLGSLTVGGKNVKEYDLNTLRDEVAMVLQKNLLFSGTIRDNLKWGNSNATDEEIKNALDIANASEFVYKFDGGLDYVLDQKATNVSGGQKQRLCIARALLKNPKIIIFDDSTSACDTITDSKIRASLKNSMPFVTKIIIAQRISSVEDADKVIVLDNGEIESFDTPKKLMKTSKIYREIYELQKKGVK